MVHAVVPNPGRFFRILVVTLKQAERLSLIGPDHNLSPFTGLRGRSVRKQQVDVVLGIGQAHAAGLGFHPREGSQGHGGFGLAEALAQFQPRERFEFFENRAVQRLAGRAGPAQGTEVVFGEVFLDEEAVNGRRRAEGGDVVIGHLLQQVGRRKLLMIIDKDRGAGEPLAVHLAPDGLAPAGIGNGQVQAVFTQVMPIDARHQMAQRIGKVMGDHLGFPAGPGREIHQHGIAVLVPAEEGIGFLAHPAAIGRKAGLLPFAGVVAETSRDQRADTHGFTDGRARGKRLADMFQDGGFPGAQNSFDISPLAAVDDVVGRQQMGGGDGDGADFVQRQHRYPELVAAPQHEHDAVAPPDAQLQQIGRRLVRHLFQVPEGEAFFLSLVIGPQHRQFIRRLPGPDIHNIISKVEMLRHIDVEMTDKVLLGDKFRLL